MIDLQMSSAKFLLGWLPALAVSASVDPQPRLGDLFLVDLAGLPVPVVTCALGALGIMLSRLFAGRTEAELSWPLRLVVSTIMLIVVELWIVESRPSWLYAFVVAVGLGFAGYSLLELFGDQVRQFLQSVFSKARETIGQMPKNGADEES